MRNAETGEIAAICEITGVHMDRQARKSAAVCARRSAERRDCRHSPCIRTGAGVNDMPPFPAEKSGLSRVATDTFDRQRAMRTLGISIARLEPGEVDLAMAYSPDFTQQNGFVHAGIITAGLDNACGIAAFTLMPAGSDILTVEFKTNLLAPAQGERFVFRAIVVKPGRTLTVCEAPRLCRA